MDSSSRNNHSLSAHTESGMMTLVGDIAVISEPEVDTFYELNDDD